jgi:cell division protein ZapA
LEKQPIKIKILNNEYLIKSDENDIDSIHRIAKYVNDKLKETDNNSKGLSEKKAAILTALNIASDYFQALKERDELLDNIRHRSESLISSINDSLK